MKLEGEKLLEHIRGRNHQQRARINQMLQVALDLENDKYPNSEGKKARKARNLCAVCFYIDKTRVAGRAITESNCSYCMKATTFPSTETDEFCVDCAKSFVICKRCGAELDLKDPAKVPFKKA